MNCADRKLPELHGLHGLFVGSHRCCLSCRWVNVRYAIDVTSLRLHVDRRPAHGGQ